MKGNQSIRVYQVVMAPSLHVITYIVLKFKYIIAFLAVCCRSFDVRLFQENNLVYYDVTADEENKKTESKPNMSICI